MDRNLKSEMKTYPKLWCISVLFQYYISVHISIKVNWKTNEIDMNVAMYNFSSHIQIEI